jgi:lipid II:glycine glycyltransferase (peptidoglycan interpeptide bridge formation enzyme)
MNSENFDSILLGLKDEQNQILAASLILIEKNTKYKYAYAPRGFLLDYQDSHLLKEFTNGVKKYLGKLGIIAIKMNPMIVKASYDMKRKIMTKNNYYDIIFNNLKNLGYRHLGYNDYFEGLKPRYVALLDLDKPYYMIFNSFHKEFRTKIRTASKKGVQVYIGGIENLEYLYLQTKRKYPRDLTYFKNAYTYFNKEKKVDFFYTKINTKLYLTYTQEEYQKQNEKVLEVIKKINDFPLEREKYIALKMKEDKLLAYKKAELIKATKLLQNYPDGIVSASAMIIKEKKQVTLFMDGYDPKFKNFHSKHLLIWKLCEKYSNEGYTTFHLGGISAVNLKENKYEGLNNFKLSFGATAIEYMGDLELVTNHPLYLINKSPISIPNIIKK